MILVIAIGKKSYLAAAINLAAAILASGENQQFTFVVDETPHLPDTLTGKVRVIEIEKGANPYLTKLLLPEMLPGEAFTYLDADSMWNPAFKPADFFGFETLACGVLPVQNLWDEKEVRKTHRIKSDVPLLAIQPSAFHFTPDFTELFAKAAKIYERLAPTFRGAAPDSLALSIACAKLEIVPARINLYSANYHRISDRDKYPLWTFPGERIREPDMRAYNLAAVKGVRFGGTGKWFGKQ